VVTGRLASQLAPKVVTNDMDRRRFDVVCDPFPKEEG
jgi:hypothetical protein